MKKALFWELKESADVDAEPKDPCRADMIEPKVNEREHTPLLTHRIEFDESCSPCGTPTAVPSEGAAKNGTLARERIPRG